MANDLVKDRLQNLTASIGRSGLASLFPSDIEVYVFALELVDANGKTKEYFVFPVNPSDVKESKPQLINIKKTSGGITTISTQTFVPTDISISGNFGRNFKFLLNSELINFSSFSFGSSLSSTIATIKTGQFSPSIKSGYGCTKILERIVNKASTIDKDTGKPYRLYLYNLALGNNYLVKPTGITFSQNQGSNMIWTYNLTLKSLSRIEDIIETSANTLTANMTANNIVQKSGNQALQVAKSFLRL